MMMMIIMMMMMIMIMILIMMIMTIESVEQRPGLGEHVLKIALILKMDEHGRIQGIQTIQCTHIASYCSYTNGGWTHYWTTALMVTKWWFLASLKGDKKETWLFEQHEGDGVVNIPSGND